MATHGRESIRTLLVATALTTTLLTSGCASDQPPRAALDEMITTVDETFPDVDTISTGELASWLGDASRPAPQLLDAREAPEYAVSRIPGAIRVDPGSDVATLAAMLDPDRPVVIYCSVGYRSSELAQRLADHTGLSPQNLTGSIFKWANEGRPLENTAGAAQHVHPYNDYFGRMLLPSLRHEP